MNVTPSPRHPQAREVFVHVGLQKSGTTFLQKVLWDSRQTLADDGVLIPGRSRQAQNLAVWDLIGRRHRGAPHGSVAGSWRRLIDEIARWEGRTAIVSDELLVHARAKQVRRVVSDLSPATVHVVVTVRDLGRVLGSAWQQELTKGRSWSWHDFATAVRDPSAGAATAGVAFWLRYDLLRVLNTWEEHVPRERIHLITVPLEGSPVGLLARRFAAATGLDPAHLDTGHPPVNTSVGPAEAKVLRLLNDGLGGRLNERQYLKTVHGAVLPALRRRAGAASIRVPATEYDWLRGRSVELTEELRRRGYDVSGDLDELLPQAPGTAHDPDDVPDDELAAAALAALVNLSERYAALWWRVRKRDAATDTKPATRLASTARAAAFRARVSALELADRNRLVGRAARSYLRRTSSPD